jgi:hypothetical protein
MLIWRLTEPTASVLCEPIRRAKSENFESRCPAHNIVAVCSPAATLTTHDASFASCSITKCADACICAIALPDNSGPSGQRPHARGGKDRVTWWFHPEADAWGLSVARPLRTASLDWVPHRGRREAIPLQRVECPAIDRLPSGSAVDAATHDYSCRSARTVKLVILLEHNLSPLEHCYSLCEQGLTTLDKAGFGAWCRQSVAARTSSPARRAPTSRSNAPG